MAISYKKDIPFNNRKRIDKRAANAGGGFFANFITRLKATGTFIAGINDADDVMTEWHNYVVEQREQDLETIITEEKLKPEDTRKFLENRCNYEE